MVIAISYSGNTDKLLRFLQILLKEDITVIWLCSSSAPLLVRSAKIMMNTKVKKEACPLNLAPTSNTIAVLALGDATAIALMQATDFKKQDFALFHPSGSLRRRLLTTAADVVKSDALPFYSRTPCLAQAIIMISEKKTGLELITNGEGK